ncbi:hypothetical protein F7725_008662 [Dissostichus mawsoni]|uniref:Uncharacterized protein n=1 Tax=Dissostichus mawsoni TaxID=36200 RepID=A0A7J5Y9R3_DISMA|nr:hypothetical protein F7725_008662 [Dissostichus mawsoni]
MGERQLLEEVLSLVLQRISVEENVRSSEQELVAVVRGLEAGRQRWLNAELQLQEHELLLKHTKEQLLRSEDLDTSVMKPLRPRAREKRRSSLGPGSGAADWRRGRSGNISAEPPGRMLEQEVETVVKASVQTPDSGEIHMEQGNTQRTQRNQRNPLQPPLTQQTHPQESFAPGRRSDLRLVPRQQNAVGART